MKNNSAIIFARVSSAVQKPNRQISDLSKFVNEREYDIKKVFVESGSGMLENDERPVLMEMLNYVVINGIKNVLITETSRLSRNISEMKKIILLFRAYRVNIFIQNININTLYEFDYSILDESIRMANYEIKLLKSRLFYS
jgi:DNA invertase Pin-like site-specific DNA recombinase